MWLLKQQSASVAHCKLCTRCAWLMFGNIYRSLRCKALSIMTHDEMVPISTWPQRVFSLCAVLTFRESSWGARDVAALRKQSLEMSLLIEMTAGEFPTKTDRRSGTQISILFLMLTWQTELTGLALVANEKGMTYLTSNLCQNCTKGTHRLPFCKWQNSTSEQNPSLALWQPLRTDSQDTALPAHLCGRLTRV